jgi:4-amino-4-deoxy-L-arabinose transferase-like glycosyltransferase
VISSKAAGAPAYTAVSTVTRRWTAVAEPLTEFWCAHPAVVICAVALAVRFAVIWASGPGAPPVAWGDDVTYDGIATKLAVGHEYANTWYPPGYPLFLTLVYLVFGHSLVIVRSIQCGLGAATCVLTFWLGRRMFDERIGRLAGFLLAIYPGHAYMCWRIMAEPLFMVLVLVALNLAARVADKPRVRSALALGASLGAAQLVKSNLYVFPALLIAWLLWGLNVPVRRRVALAAATATSALAVALITPTANLLSTGGAAAALPGNAGRTFWMANNPLADGYYVFAETEPQGRAFLDEHGFAERLARADEFEKDRLFFDLGWLWIRENPGSFLILCLKKLDNAFGLFPRAVTMEGKPAARVLHVMSYGVIAPFAVIGMIGVRRRWRPYVPLFLVVLSYVLMVLIYYGTPRFTIIVMPVLIIFASAAMYWSADRLLESRRKGLATDELDAAA